MQRNVSKASVGSSQRVVFTGESMCALENIEASGSTGEDQDPNEVVRMLIYYVWCLFLFINDREAIEAIIEDIMVFK